DRVRGLGPVAARLHQHRPGLPRVRTHRVRQQHEEAGEEREGVRSDLESGGRLAHRASRVVQTREVGIVTDVMVGDVRLAYDEFGEGEPVLLVCGTGQVALTWQLFQVPALVEAGYRVITFDNRGIG